MIGIIGAMDIEILGIEELMQIEKKETISGCKFIVGKFKEKKIVAAVCGPGKVNAAACAEAMILKYNPKLVINTGVGGTLDSGLKIGDIALSSAVVQHDVDTTPLGDPAGFLSGINRIKIEADKVFASAMEKALLKTGLNYKTGIIASGDQFINASEKKEFIKNTFDGICCEMEGASIGHICLLNQVPFVVLRAISDGADESSHMSYSEFCAFAAANTVKVLSEFFDII